MSVHACARCALFDYGFRPFFLLAAVAAVTVVALWLLVLAGGHWPGAPANPLFWHMHEMLYGFIAAAIGGFLLTAVPSWTGQPPLKGTPLVWLTAAWLVGRLGAALAGWLPLPLVALLDLLFLPALTGVTIRQLRASGNRKNYFIAGLLALLVLADALYYLALAGWATFSPALPLTAALHVVLFLVAVIGGRIIPSFTGNWLNAHGSKVLPIIRPTLDKAALLATLSVGLAVVLTPPSLLTGVLALTAAALHGTRLAGWRGLHTPPEWLLTVLHVGYAWLVVGYALLGLAAFGLLLPSAAVHALTMGAIGTLVLAVMSRASLGHTGRKLHAGRGLALSYLLVSLATLARIGAGLLPAFYSGLLGTAAVLWIAAFGLFIVLFWPILSRPRMN